MLSLNEIYYHARSQYNVTLYCIQQNLRYFTLVTLIRAPTISKTYKTIHCNI
ncbi:conserved hypothetical protein [Vibrio diabolicus]|nr:conserved hypothetical protein [Vibrio diabolicus]